MEAVLWGIASLGDVRASGLWMDAPRSTSGVYIRCVVLAIGFVLLFFALVPWVARATAD